MCEEAAAPLTCTVGVVVENVDEYEPPQQNDFQKAYRHSIIAVGKLSERHFATGEAPPEKKKLSTPLQDIIEMSKESITTLQNIDDKINFVSTDTASMASSLRSMASDTKQALFCS